MLVLSFIHHHSSTFSMISQSHTTQIRFRKNLWQKSGTVSYICIYNTHKYILWSATKLSCETKLRNFYSFFSQILLLNIISGSFRPVCDPQEYWSGSECCPMCPRGKIQLQQYFSLHSILETNYCQSAIFWGFLIVLLMMEVLQTHFCFLKNKQTDNKVILYIYISVHPLYL